MKKQEKKNRKRKAKKNLGMALYFILISFLIYLGTGVIVIIAVIALALAGVPVDAFNITLIDNLNMISFVVLVGTILSAFFSRYITRPYYALNEATKKVAAGDFSIRIEPNGPREVREMAESFNTMAKELGGIETLRNDFISNVSHEFKTPAASIKGFAMLAKKESVSPQRRNEYLDFIIKESDRLAQLTGNVLLLSRLEQQELGLEKNTFLLDEQLRRVILLLEPEWNKKGIEIFTDLTKVSYTGYEELLMQVWINLIGNAIKFTDKDGSVDISLSRNENAYIVKIADSGIGMSAETVHHIFDKFFQNDKSHSSEGNGLGLSLVKRIVEMSNGKILVESEIEKGTTVSVVLPYG